MPRRTPTSAASQAISITREAVDVAGEAMAGVATIVAADNNKTAAIVEITTTIAH